VAELGFTFNANDVAPRVPFEPIPAGDYKVWITDSEMKATQKGDGQLLKLEMEIVEGDLKGRKIWDQLNLVNQNEDTVRIAYATLSSICRAVGEMLVSTSDPLHFKPMIIKVAYVPAGKDKNGVERQAQNQIKGYLPVSGSIQASTANRAPSPMANGQAGVPGIPDRAPARTSGMPPSGSSAPWRK
jgi:hypothetical protein